MKKFIFTLLILIGGIFVVGRSNEVEAYHLNEEGNVVSENILGLPDIAETTVNGITYSINNGTITLNGTASAYTSVRIKLLSVIDIGEYTFVVNKSGNHSTGSTYSYVGLLDNGQSTIFNIHTFIKTSDNLSLTKKAVYLYFDANEGTELKNYQIKPMVVEGSTVPTIYEPYGTYYKINVQNQNFNVASATATWSGQTTAVNVMDKLIVHSDTLYLEEIISYTDSSNIEITINLASTLSTDLLYAFRFEGSIGSAIYIYQNENLIYNIESEECKNNICVIDLSETGYSNFNKIVVTGANQDYYPIAFSYFSNLYQAGYDSGYNDGNYDGHGIGYNKGYNEGYTTGNSQAELDIYGFLPGIIGAILSFFYTIMQFSVFGISLFDIFVLFFGISMVILILKIINGGGD